LLTLLVLPTYYRLATLGVEWFQGGRRDWAVFRSNKAHGTKIEYVDGH